MEPIEKVRKYILEQDRYCLAKEIAENTGLSLFTLYKSIPEGLEAVNISLGKYPGSNASKDLEEKIRLFISSVDFFVSGLYIANNLNISRATLRKHNISVDSLNEEFGRKRVFGPKLKEPLDKSEDTEKPLYIKGKTLNNTKRLSTDSELVESIIDIIKQEDRYVPSTYLSEKLNVSPATLSYRGIDTEEINFNLGYVRTNRFFETKVGEFLSEIFPGETLISQQWFKDLTSRKGNCLYFDFYLPGKRILVEADGPCHFDEKHPWFTERVVLHDRLKKEYCEKVGYTLVRIPYKIDITKEYVYGFLGSPESLSATADLETEDAKALRSERIGQSAANVLNKSGNFDMDAVQRLSGSSESSAQAPLTVHDIVSTSSES